MSTTLIIAAMKASLNTAPTLSRNISPNPPNRNGLPKEAVVHI